MMIANGNPSTSPATVLPMLEMKKTSTPSKTSFLSLFVESLNTKFSSSEEKWILKYLKTKQQIQQS